MPLALDYPSAAEEYFVAGQKVPAGVYLNVEFRREVQLKDEDVLPATCDGRVAVYVRRPRTWAEMSQEFFATMK
jgi:hypothetical protein